MFFWNRNVTTICLCYSSTTPRASTLLTINTLSITFVRVKHSKPYISVRRYMPVKNTVVGHRRHCYMKINFCFISILTIKFRQKQTFWTYSTCTIVFTMPLRYGFWILNIFDSVKRIVRIAYVTNLICVAYSLIV